MVISMEQEVLRAHQRATKSHTVISACSLLLEQLLPKTHCERSNGDVAHIHPNITRWVRNRNLRLLYAKDVGLIRLSNVGLKNNIEPTALE